ncbi:bifunctional adenosylcobinamide kinase/adenosylcobinamide-phosphate guanylyltransferase [Fuscibacter oryzae]|uniref:Bifunctional adenosylcobalamin biosynthesis protein n=1 Tax=Fuscibacter oryzae TaxID=2803939 RepID=A0A8J7MQ32_9RHOB|nr:bifunctional adenosylcobinamide kinase/adenosylcobinamide-phosphate guanylyltransferase [Fuscibacter oryzae]MBL4926620.1 bifunctional adenosylcobinamide kinase/adenosylcobinamide-phosphate guanylyltransferase [Fuscibacter oryzae]
MPGSHLLQGFPRVSLVVGGARSGKSRLAEGLVRAAGLPLTYIATAQAWDDEMAARIAQHRDDRGGGWQTVEAPRDLCGALAGAQGAVLVDCATLWLTNVMLAEGDLGTEVAAVLAALQAHPGPVVVVSNEVGWGIVPENALARRFRDEQGRLNQQIAALADLVVGVMAGLPMVLKGALPEGAR